MKKILLLIALATCSATLWAADTNSPAADTEAKYSASLEGRAADILKVLALTDTNQAVKIHDLVIAHYRALRAWHETNDARLKAAKGDTNAMAQIRASLKALHGEFLAALGTTLSPQQIEQVKDKLTYGKVQFTMAGYLTQYPNLAETNKVEILRLLKEAREEAMDGGSAAEKTAVFQRYKGRINNYLSTVGVIPAKARKAPVPPPAASSLTH
jgi:hypothetical protein